MEARQQHSADLILWHSLRAFGLQAAHEWLYRRGSNDDRLSAMDVVDLLPASFFLLDDVAS